MIKLSLYVAFWAKTKKCVEREKRHKPEEKKEEEKEDMRLTEGWMDKEEAGCGYLLKGLNICLWITGDVTHTLTHV